MRGPFSASPFMPTSLSLSPLRRFIKNTSIDFEKLQEQNEKICGALGAGLFAFSAKRGLPDKTAFLSPFSWPGGGERCRRKASGTENGAAVEQATGATTFAGAPETEVRQAALPTVRVLVLEVSEGFGAESETLRKQRLARTAGTGGHRAYRGRRGRPALYPFPDRRRSDSPGLQTARNSREHQRAVRGSNLLRSTIQSARAAVVSRFGEPDCNFSGLPGRSGRSPVSARDFTGLRASSGAICSSVSDRKIPVLCSKLTDNFHINYAFHSSKQTQCS